jgi:hypothetical protein
MNVDELLMLNHDMIDYDSLPDEALRQLALEVEPFIATSALTELSIRRGALAAPTAREILDRADSDRHLRAAALEVLFKLNRDQALAYMAARIQQCDRDFLPTIAEIVIENQDVFASGRGAELADGLARCLGEGADAEPVSSNGAVDAFLRLRR